MTYKAHYDGHTIVLDEPVQLMAGQEVEVSVTPTGTQNLRALERAKYFGILKDMPKSGRQYTEELRGEWEGRP